MKKSFFSKFYYVCTTFLIISVLVMGASLLVYANRLYQDEKRDKLDNVSEVVIERISTLYESYIEIDSYQTLSEIEDKHLNYNVQVYIFNSDGGFIIGTESNNSEDSEIKSAVFSKSFLENHDDDSVYFKIGYLNGITSELSACRIQKFTVSRTHDEPVSYYLVATTSAADLNSFSKNLFIYFGVAAAIVTLITSVLFIMTTKRIIRPFTKMSEKAEDFIKGDYSQRLPVDDTEEFSRLALSFNEMANTIEKYETTHKNFIANISHELRTPMTTIGGFIDGILDGTIPKEESRHYMELVSEEIRRLSRLVKTMLSISKFEANEMLINYENVNITDLIINTILMFEKKINEKHVNVEGLDGPNVDIGADKDLLSQLFYNIIENAVKFVDEYGIIRFSISQTDKYAVISLKNTGEGLSEEEIPKIFKRFYKTDESRGIDASGIGLGLSIVRSIINLHNGTITVKSVKDEYTEFIIELPLKKLD
ncbi:MAG: HAMP domain-containing histidine kinase [Clostridiales bacterium]|nr:HAMP domain-containing histidine kinase [Clostridiales bacterium]